MAKMDYRFGTLTCTASAVLLAVISSLLILAALIWQGLIVFMPMYSTMPSAVECVYEVPRREGYTHTCYTMSPTDKDVDSVKNPCVPLDYVVPGTQLAEVDDGHVELTEWRRISMILVVMAFILAVVGLILIGVYVRSWLQSMDRLEFNRLQRLLPGLSFMLAGFLCHLGLVFLHLTYLRDKVVKTNRLQLIYTSWDKLFSGDFVISYSHSYWMLVASVVLLEIAGIIMLIAGHLSHLLPDTPDNSMGEMHIANKYTPILPRYITEGPDESEYDSYGPTETNSPEGTSYR